jgi:D-alanyl-D-alanine carboxypeptidase
VIGRRALIGSSLALGLTAPTWAGRRLAGKRSAIDSIDLPPLFNGALAYARQGQVEHIRCVGLADVEAKTPVAPSTQYKWGSATKWLTSAAVLRLVERNILSLDAPIGAYLPDLREETGKHVLVRHLLSNTSGIPDLLSRQVGQEPELRTSTASAAAIVARFAKGDLAFTPGQGWDYAALNWVIVAALLERLTGEKLAETVTRLVLQPLGMSSAGFAQADQPDMPALAAAYASTMPLTRKMSPVPPFLAASGNAAGTVGDAVRAAHGIFHGALLSPASRQELSRVRWAEQEYALGGRIHQIDGEAWAWETGKLGGYRTHIAHRLSRSETVVIFNTTDMEQSVIGTWAETIARA